MLKLTVCSLVCVLWYVLLTPTSGWDEAGFSSVYIVGFVFFWEQVIKQYDFTPGGEFIPVRTHSLTLPQWLSVHGACHTQRWWHFFPHEACRFIDQGTGLFWETDAICLPRFPLTNRKSQVAGLVTGLSRSTFTPRHFMWYQRLSRGGETKRIFKIYIFLIRSHGAGWVTDLQTSTFTPRHIMLDQRVTSREGGSEVRFLYCSNGAGCPTPGL